MDIINFKYKFRKPKQLENDVFVIFSPKKITLSPGEDINLNVGVEISLPKYVEGTTYLLSSLRNQNLQLLNSKCISQKYNRNIEIEEIYKKELQPWILILNLKNNSLIETLTIGKGKPIVFLDLYNVGEEINYKFKKDHILK